MRGRKKWDESVEAMQKDLDEYLTQYNTKCPHQGRNMKGRTPKKVFKEGLTKIKKTAKLEPQKAA